MKKFAPILTMATAITLSLSHTAMATVLTAPTELKVGPLLTDPLGYSEQVPQFSWKLPDDLPGLHQSAYQIVCASTLEKLTTEPDLWDSGWVNSSQSLFVDYEGRPLQSRERLYWRVRYKNSTGIPSEWSDPAALEMSLLERDDWQAQWIFLPEEKPEESPPAPFLRKEFSLKDKPIRTARLYASARGIYEMHVNGVRVGDDYFQPEWTDYTRRSLFVTYDVTNLLHPKTNAIGSILGEMWYAGKMGYASANNLYGDTPQLLAQLEVTYADGERQVIVTDESWKAARGPITFANIYDGERYDARLEFGSWSSPGFDDSAWEKVTAAPIEADIILSPRPNQPVRAIMEIRPKSVKQIGPGAYIFDIGQNMVGWARIKVPGARDHTYTLRFAEMLQDDGSLYTANYRTAESTDTYTCRGDAIEVWEPRLTFHGFRYVELSGVPDGLEPTEDWVTAVVLHNEMPPTGSFKSSHSMLNQLQSNIQWGQRGNFLAVPTDCPQRDERLGWTGDAQVFVSTANYNFDTLAFFVKWCADMRDSQHSSGSIPFFIPSFVGYEARTSTAWGDAAVIVPWEVYQSFGYRRILEDNYRMMCEWVRHYEEHEETKDYIHSGFTFGDWLQPYTTHKSGTFGDTDTALIGTAYFARCADLLARSAAVLGKDDDARRYRELFQNIRTAFQNRFFDDDGRVTTTIETQTSYLLAIGFDLIDDQLKEKALQHLVRHIEDVASGHLRTGFVGTPLIAPVLSNQGRVDLAYDILFRTTYPGWFYSIEQGATTMWERWNSYSKEEGFGAVSMNSFNHYAYGAIGEWLYETVAGMSLVEPGYKRIRFNPAPGGPLTMAEARLETPYGTASSRWERIGDHLLLHVTVPPNTTGEVVLHDAVQILDPGGHTFTLPAN